MKSTPKKKKPDARIAIRLPKDELTRLDEKLARMRKKMPAFELTRSDAVRTAIREFTERP